MVAKLWQAFKKDAQLKAKEVEEEPIELPTATALMAKRILGNQYEAYVLGRRLKQAAIFGGSRTTVLNKEALVEEDTVYLAQYFKENPMNMELPAAKKCLESFKSFRTM